MLRTSPALRRRPDDDGWPVTGSQPGGLVRSEAAVAMIITLQMQFNRIKRMAMMKAEIDHLAAKNRTTTK